MISKRNLAWSLAFLLLAGVCVWILTISQLSCQWSGTQTPQVVTFTDQRHPRRHPRRHHNETRNASTHITTRHNKTWLRYRDHDLSRFFSPLIGTPEFEELKVFILDFPFIDKSDKPECRSMDPSKAPPGTHRLVRLHSHKSRTFNMSEADLIFSSCFIEHNYFYPCQCKYHNLTQDQTKYTSKTRREVAEYHAQIDYFHSLKAAGTIRPHAWLVIQDDHNELDQAGVMEDSIFNDLSVVGLGALGRDFVGDSRIKDVSTARVQTRVKSLWNDKGKWTTDPHWQINCSRYQNLAFFKGRNHESWLPQVQIKDVGYGELDHRHECVRCNMTDALQGNPQATELGIQFHTKTRRGDYTPQGHLFDFDEYMKTSHFCFAPSGNVPWSYRFYEAMEHGCIPVVISGSWLLPYSPAVVYKHLAVRISEDFDFKNVRALKNKMLKDADSDLCEQHHNVKRVWEFIKTDDHEFQLWLASIKIRFLQKNITLPEDTVFFKKK